MLEAGDDDTATFTNRYLVSYLEIKKEVSGNQGSRDKFFKFTVNLSGCVPDSTLTVDLSKAVASPRGNRATSYTGMTNPETITVDKDGKATATFYLQHGNSVRILDLPYGASYTVTEIPEDYKPSLAITGDLHTGDDAATTGTAISISVEDGKASATDSFLTENTTLTFTNIRDGTVPTGLAPDQRGAAAMVVFGVSGLTLMLAAGLLRRRRKRYE